ncbi:MAG: F0F1 ATP synthase subunit B, partial [Campylobacterota bacterium]
ADLAVSSKKENKIINDNIMTQCDADIETMIKHQAVLIEFEQRKMVRSVVEDTLKDALSQSDDGFDKEAMANVILKKVA